MSDVINIENTFSVLIYDVLFISDVKINLSQIFLNFQNGRHFEGRASFLTGSCIGSWVQRWYSQFNSLHFEFLIDVLAQIITELWQFQILPTF